ncbi:MAG: hypothetical protein U0166_01610 [Acidobacteriota bacterium]
MKRLSFVLAVIVVASAAAMGLRDLRLARREQRFTPGASWIARDDRTATGDLSRSFELLAEPASAVLRVAIEPAGAVRLNGSVLYRGGLHDGFRRIQEIDPTPFLRRGTNEISLSIPADGSALLWLDVRDPSGTSLTIGSDGSWQAPGGRARVRHRGWLRPFRSVREPMRVVATASLRSEAPRFATLADGLYDLGAEDVGFPVIQGCPPGTRVFYGESRAEALAATPPQSDDVATIDAGGVGFRRRAFRFARVSPEASGARIGIVGVRGGAPPRGAFACSDDTLNHAYAISRRTIELCAQGVLEDGVKRDHAAWVGDLLVSLPATFYVFGPHPAAARTLRLLGGSTNARGQIVPVYPSFGDWVLDDYDAAWLVALERHVALSGDRRIVEELRAPIARGVERLRSRLERGPFIVSKEGPITDWMSHRARTGDVVYQRGMAMLALRAGAALAAGTQADDAAAPRSVDRAGLQSPDGLFVDRTGVTPPVYTQDASVLAVLSGLAADDAPRVLAALESRLWTVHGTRAYLEPSDATGAIASGLVIAPFMVGLEALARFEHDDSERACELLRRTWTPMTESGCAYEFLDLGGHALAIPGQPPYAHSLCHAWSAAPAWLLPAYVLGVRPERPGFASYVVAPRAGSLSRLSGTVPIEGGAIDVAITIVGDEAYVDLDVPSDRGGWLVPAGLFPGSSTVVSRDGAELPARDRYAIPGGVTSWVVARRS